MSRFTKHGTDKWGEYLDVKNFLPIGSSKKYNGKTIIISSVTDPYNPFEKKYQKTKMILEELINFDSKIEILTKSSLVLRDIDIFKQMKDITIGFSLSTHDNLVGKLLEPQASTIETRIEALQVLSEHNIKTFVFISPIFPAITDIDLIVNKVAPYTDYIMFENLSLKPPYKQRVLSFIKNSYPHLYPLYEDIYIKNNRAYWDTVLQKINALDIDKRIFFDHGKP